MTTQNEIIDYYDISKVAYKDVWHLDKCMALHYGFWEKGVYNLKQALIKENERLAKIAGIKSNDKVLDAGCGVGGSSLFLAKNYGCKVHGITLSENQVRTAKDASKRVGLTNLVDFSVEDFHHTSFQDNSFDVIWFVESFCHSTEPERLLNEMTRILKPSGRIIIADGFQTEKEQTNKDVSLMNNWLNNWAIQSILKSSTAIKLMENLDYNSINNLNYSKKIFPSALLLYIYANLAIYYGSFCKFLGKNYGNQITIKNSVGAKYQFLALKRKLWQYQVITAVKSI